MGMMQYPVPPAHLQAIGRIAVCFSGLELQLSLLVGLLVAPHDSRLGQIITAELSFKGLLALAASTYRHKETEQARLSEFEEILKHAGQLEDERNQIMHCIWGAGSTADKICRVKVTAKQKRGHNVKFEEKSLADLEQLANSLAVLAGEILDWQIRYAEISGLMKTINRTP